jgi:hypothetical protein
VPDVGDSILSAFKKLDTMLKNNVIPWNSIVALGSDYANAAAKFFTNAAASGEVIAEAAWSAASEALTKLGDQAAEEALKALDAAKNAIDAANDAALATAKEKATKAMDAAKDAVAKVLAANAEGLEAAKAEAAKAMDAAKAAVAEAQAAATKTKQVVTTALASLFSPQMACVDVKTDASCKTWAPSVNICAPSGVTCTCCDCIEKSWDKCILYDPVPKCVPKITCFDTKSVCVEWNPVKACQCIMNC